MNSNILILGGRSFVATGLTKLLSEHGYEVDSSSRGNETKRDGNIVYGDIFNLNLNKCFKTQYDVVINFAVIKDGTVDSNIGYIKEVIEFCKAHGVKKIIHFSSIMVYNYQLKKVDENTKGETLDETTKRGYGEFKIGVDEYLNAIKKDLPFEVVLVRPGYVLAGNRPCPFIKNLPMRMCVIKGNYNSKQPIVKREDIHKALLHIIETEHNNEVYHFFPNNAMTKYRYAKNRGCKMILIMPKWIFDGIPHMFAKLGLIPMSLYSRFEGMYIESDFQSTETEKKLNMKFE